MSYELIHGDCIEEMKKLIDDGVKVDLILTDPPYGTTQCKWDTIIDLDDMWDCMHDISYSTTPKLLFGDEPFSSHLRLSNIKEWKYDWIWVKDGPSNIFNAKVRPLKYHEFISVFYKKQCAFYPDRIQIPRISRRVSQAQRSNYTCITKASSVVTGNHVKSGKYISDFSKYDKNWKNPSQHIYFSRIRGNSHEKVNHPTQKPVELLKHFIKAYSNEGDTVLDFTMGSGSTGVACMNLNRKFIGIELDENYFKIAEKRLLETNAQRKLL